MGAKEDATIEKSELKIRILVELHENLFVASLGHAPDDHRTFF